MTFWELARFANDGLAAVKSTENISRMDDLRSHSEVVRRALCRHWNGATVKTSTETM
jgi:hypothetical protein